MAKNPKNTGADPRTVLAPRWHLNLIDVLYEDEDWSLAVGQWRDDEGQWRPVLLQRWNGWNGSKGNPVSSGHPTWFVVPDFNYKMYVTSEYSPIPEDKRDWLRDVLNLPPYAGEAKIVPTLVDDADYLSPLEMAEADAEEVEAVRKHREFMDRLLREHLARRKSSAAPNDAPPEAA